MRTDMDKGRDRQAGKATVETAAEAREIDWVLASASVPPLPEGAVSRLMARILEEPQQADPVIPFRARPLPDPQPARPSLLRYAAALPLAASLALGVYLGARGTLDFMLPTAITGLALGDEGLDDLGGVGEADDYAAEHLS